MYFLAWVHSRRARISKNSWEKSNSLSFRNQNRDSKLACLRLKVTMFWGNKCDTREINVFNFFLNTYYFCEHRKIKDKKTNKPLKYHLHQNIQVSQIQNPTRLFLLSLYFRHKTHPSCILYDASTQWRSPIRAWVGHDPSDPIFFKLFYWRNY